MPFINGIGPGEIIIILIIALIVVGPGKLPDVGSALGKSIREFRKAATDVKESTSLDPVSATPAPAQQVTAPSAVAAVPPVAGAAAPAPVATNPAAQAVAAAPVADVAPDPVAEPAPDPVAATAPDAPVAAAEAPVAASPWPEELTSADEQQRTPSA
jgi:TatA/E family protein of Tat protein translocase